MRCELAAAQDALSRGRIIFADSAAVDATEVAIASAPPLPRHLPRRLAASSSRASPSPSSATSSTAAPCTRWRRSSRATTQARACDSCRPRSSPCRRRSRIRWPRAAAPSRSTRTSSKSSATRTYCTSRGCRKSGCFVEEYEALKLRYIVTPPPWPRPAFPRPHASSPRRRDQRSLRYRPSCGIFPTDGERHVCAHGAASSLWAPISRRLWRRGKYGCCGGHDEDKCRRRSQDLQHRSAIGGRGWRGSGGPVKGGGDRSGETDTLRCSFRYCDAIESRANL